MSLTPPQLVVPHFFLMKNSKQLCTGFHPYSTLGASCPGCAAGALIQPLSPPLPHLSDPRVLQAPSRPPPLPLLPLSLLPSVSSLVIPISSVGHLYSLRPLALLSVLLSQSQQVERTASARGPAAQGL